MSRCGGCGRPSRDDLRFCGWCGHPLDSAQFDERKTVTAVFCDLVGYVARTDRADAEDIRQLILDYRDAVLPVFEHAGGTFERLIGDGLLVLFGTPRAHEDDPERAVRSSLACLEALDRFNAARPDLDLHVHIGVTTGETLVRLRSSPATTTDGVWGTSVNTASRLEAAAAADEILVDDETYRATRNGIEYRAVVPVRAKGISERVVAWRAVRARPPRALSHVGTPPLCGRAGEVTALRAALAAAVSRSETQLVTLVGNAGIGKSRLVLELLRAVEGSRRAITWRHGRSPAYPPGTTFWALGEIVKREAGLLDTDDAARAREKLSTAVRALVPEAESERVERHLGPLVGLGDATDVREGREGAFDAWSQFIRALAERSPLVLIFEDLHWAGEGLLDFVEHLHERAADLRLLIVCTTRRDGGLPMRCRRLGRKPRAATLELQPLSEAASRDLVVAAAGTARISPKVLDRIVSKAAGNPLYAVELMRMQSEPLAARGAGDDLPLSRALRSIMAARLDTLPLDDKQLLQVGAVIGRAVWPTALSEVMGRHQDWVLERLRALEAGEFLFRRADSSVAGELEYRFEHSLIRDAAYDSIPRYERIRIHERLAEWTEKLSPDRATDRAEMLAHHYSCAHELARETGADAERLWIAAREAFLAAGDRALALQSFPAADNYFRRALALWPYEHPDRPYVLLRLGKATYKASCMRTGALPEAAAALEAIGNRGAAAEAETFLAYLAHNEGHRDMVNAHVSRAVELVRDAGSSSSKAEVLVDVANISSLARQHEQTVEAAEQAIAIADELELAELRAHALASIGISRGLGGDARGRDDLSAAIDIMEEVGSHLSAHCLGMLADLECQTGDLAACFAYQARARSRAQEAGHAGFVRWLAAEQVSEHYWTGRWHEACAEADAFLAEPPHFMDGYCRVMRGRIRLARGDDDGARADAAEALEFARGADEIQMLYPALAFAARAEATGGSQDDAAALAHELLDVWSSKRELYPVSSWATDLAYAVSALGGVAALEAPLRACAPTRWRDAVLALIGGEYAAAAESFRSIGSRPDEAFARRLAADAGDLSQAREQRALADAFYREVGATWAPVRPAAVTGRRFAPTTSVST